MNKTIIVGEVFDYHDCRGKKTVEVTDSEYSHPVPTRFRMTSNYMLPFYKTMLSCVLPHDYVNIVTLPSSENALLIGEYIDNLSDVEKRDQHCKCGSVLVTDGFDVYCPNTLCHLTILARMERLANTIFFPIDIPPYDVETKEYFQFTGIEYSSTPFKHILDSRLWGYQFESLDTILLNIKVDVSLATFLVEPLFIDLLDNLKTPLAYNNKILQAVGYLFGYMNELVNRRDYSSRFQNSLIMNFIWSLGIHSLRPETITEMLKYETGVGYSVDPISPYVYLLTKPEMMQRELRLSPIESQLIYQEVFNRRHELYDIFSHYSSTDVVSEIMGHILR